MKPVAICKNMKLNPHPFFWSDAFAEICEEDSIPYEIVNPYDQNFLRAVNKYSAVIWHYSMGVHADAMEASNILSLIERKGIPTFPDYSTRWFNDEKILESYLLEEIGAPTPRYNVFYEKDECLKWLSRCQYPVVAKLKTGSGSSNVKLLKNKTEAIPYVNKMFGAGLKANSKIVYKIYSKVQSTHSVESLKKRIKQIPSYLKKVADSRWMPKESGYCYFQEYIPNNGFDLKIVTVGDKVSFISRKTRKGDFRASGGGECYYDKKLVTENIIKSAFDASDKLHSQCMGFDYVVDKNTGKGYILEMCFGFDWQTLAEAGGYWDRDCKWHDDAVIIPKEILYQLIGRK